MRRDRRRSDGNGGSVGGDSWAGYSDLMAGLLLIFIFVTVLKDVQLKEQVEKAADPARILREWHEARRELCNDEELKKHRLAPDCDTGTITLPNEVFFDFNEERLTTDGKKALRGAIPIVLRKLRSKQPIWSRLSVEVRGHSDPVGRRGYDPYPINLKKSEARAREVLLYLTSDPDVPEIDRSDLQKRGFASGAAYFQPPKECQDSAPACHDRMRRVEILLHLESEDIQRELGELLNEILQLGRTEERDAELG